MADVFSPARQARTWRDLWIALAETERDLGVDVPEEAIAAMHAARDEVDLARVAELEADLRHDVMAHVHHFGELAPSAKAYIHLGATSCFVTDNAGLIQPRQGLEIVRSRRFDLILMDVHMPRMDGVKATAHIRALEVAQRRPRTPIVALTAHAMSEDRQKCLDAGCDDYLSKPVDNEQLLEILGKYLSEPSKV